MTTIPLADLIEDTAIYPRHAVDDAHVGQLVLALKAGTELPPVVVDRKSKRIVDGVHRVRAYRRVVGENASIDADLRSYKDEAAILLDAISLNASHGRRLDRVDQVRVIMLAERAGITAVQVAAVLHIPAERVETLRVRVATIGSGGNGNAIPGTNQLALKRPVAHMSGMTLTPQQAATMRSVPGTSYLLIAKQLTDALRYKLINQADDKLLAALEELDIVLDEYLSETLER